MTTLLLAVNGDDEPLTVEAEQSNFPPLWKIADFKGEGAILDTTFMAVFAQVGTEVRDKRGSYRTERRLAKVSHWEIAE